MQLSEGMRVRGRKQGVGEATFLMGRTDDEEHHADEDHGRAQRARKTHHLRCRRGGRGTSA